MADTESELRRKKGSMGSGNMSSAAITSDGAAMGGYGYAPLYEAVAQAGGYSNSLDMIAAASAGNSQSDSATNNAAADASETVAQYAGLSAADLDAQANAASLAISNPTSLFGVDVTKAGVGFGASTLVGMLGVANPYGLVGLAASLAAKAGVDASRRNTLHALTEEQMQREAAVELENMRAIEQAATPQTEDPIGELIASLETKEQSNITQVTDLSADPLGAWIAANVANEIPSGNNAAPDEAGLQSVVDAAVNSPDFNGTTTADSSASDSGGWGGDNGGYSGSDDSDGSSGSNW